MPGRAPPPASPPLATAPLATVAFTARVIAWRGPAPYVFAAVPAEHVAELRHAAMLASYGWGVLPVHATLHAAAGPVAFRTSLFPRDGTYLVPLKRAVQTAADLALEDDIALEITVFER